MVNSRLRHQFLSCFAIAVLSVGCGGQPSGNQVPANPGTPPPKAAPGADGAAADAESQSAVQTAPTAEAE
jgi:hypothetical protein